MKFMLLMLPTVPGTLEDRKKAATDRAQ